MKIIFFHKDIWILGQVAERLRATTPNQLVLDRLLLPAMEIFLSLRSSILMVVSTRYTLLKGTWCILSAT
jgi:hypothetical protein